MSKEQPRVDLYDYNWYYITNKVKIKSMKNNLKSTIRKSWKLVALLGLFLLILIILEVTDTTHIFHRSKPNVSTVPTLDRGSNRTSKKVESTTNGTNNNSTSSVNDSQKQTAPQASTTNDLTAPYGSFVSNHHPSSQSDIEESVCTTSPGAECYIEFTNGTTIKKLPAKIIDSTGSTYWIWKPSDIGVGTWKVTAIASLDGKTKSTTDQLSLEIK